MLIRARCKYCGKVHSDWLSCERAELLGEVEEWIKVDSGEVVEGKVFDRREHMARMREKRWGKG